MARDRANIRTDIWNDDDFRELSGPAQLLYLQLLTSATLTYAGVADWRPKRIASLSAKRTANAVDDAAAELVAGLYIVVDEDTEEAFDRVDADRLVDHLAAAGRLAEADADAAAGGGQHKALRQIHRHVFHRMHGNIGTTFA